MAIVWKTKPGPNTWEEIKKRNGENKGAEEFGNSNKQQEKESEWKKGPHGTAEKKDI